MIPPSKKVAERLAWELCVRAVGAIAAVAIISGLIVAIADAEGGLTIVVAGAGLLSMCWGLTGPGR